MPTDFPLDSAIVAVVISALVTGLIIIIKEYRIEPNKWKKDKKLDILDKRLQAYGVLISFLKTAKTRGENWNHNKGRHSLVKDNGTLEFQQIFQNNYYLFTSNLNDEYIKAIKSDTKFGLTTKPSKYDYVTTSHFSLDLSTMQKLAEGDYEKLLTEYERLTGYELSKNLTEPYNS